MAKKDRTVFFCSHCGMESPKWLGQCPGCREWNSFQEAPAADKRRKKENTDIGYAGRRPAYLHEIDTTEEERLPTGYGEFDRVLGGGLVKGSLVLIGGDPGVGKSTLLLQVCNRLGDKTGVLYISGEESLRQIKLRADRLGGSGREVKFLCETDLNRIESVLLEEGARVLVIDSIQTMVSDVSDSSPGSVSQVRECTAALMRIAKTNSIAIFIVGHVTKEGQVAGPRILEHMVDTVVYFEGDKSAGYRILRAVKNRFGSTNEIGVFEMRGEGLAEVQNPSEYMLSGRPGGASGAAVACLLEGTRPILLEVQALVTESYFGMPKRTAVGMDHNRLHLLLAVAQKHCRLPFSRYDVYVNIAGGIRTNEPALDLAVVLALVSGLKDRPVDDRMLVIGEVGLSGEVRLVNHIRLRVQEGKKLGFTGCILPASALGKLGEAEGMRLYGVKNIREAIELLHSSS